MNKGSNRDMKVITSELSDKGSTLEGYESVNINPQWDYLVCLPIERNKTEGGIHLPDKAKQDDMFTSLVIKAGPGVYRDNGIYIPNPVKVGTVIYHMARSPSFKCQIKGKLYLLVAGMDVVATAERE